MSPPVALLCSRPDNKIIGRETGGGDFKYLWLEFRGQVSAQIATARTRDDYRLKRKRLYASWHVTTATLARHDKLLSLVDWESECNEELTHWLYDLRLGQCAVNEVVSLQRQSRTDDVGEKASASPRHQCSILRRTACAFTGSFCGSVRRLEFWCGGDWR